MAYKINEACTACGTCKETCPVDAIKEGSPSYIIEADLCIDCGVCVESCPAKAIIAG